MKKGTFPKTSPLILLHQKILLTGAAYIWVRTGWYLGECPYLYCWWKRIIV